MTGVPTIRLCSGPDEFRAAIAVRVRVFVEEQGGPLEDEPDPWDAGAEQFLVLDGSRVVGTARLLQCEPGVGRIGRVALLAGYRGRGWGAALLRAVLERCRARGFGEAELHAQVHATPFYERLGFQPLGGEFTEAGLPHRRMRLRLI